MPGSQTNTVSLLFAELYFSSPGGRVFNFQVGNQVVNNFDIVQTAGAKNTVLVENFSNVSADSSGYITITFTKGTADQPAVNGIIVSSGNGSSGVTCLTGPVTATSPIMVTNGSSAPALSLGTVPVTNGGTGATTLTGYLSGNGTGAFTASSTIPASALSGNITGSAANVTGTVAVANGGTGGSSLTQGQILFGQGTSAVGGSSSLFWDSSNSRLGLGTTSPAYPLDVESQVTTAESNYGYLGQAGSGVSSSSNNLPISIWASNRVVASEFDALSDARIKHIVERSNPAADLGTLSKLRITDYTYIDTVGRGSGRKKGLIAQEVEKVYPDAVRVQADFIPNVYALATRISYNVTTHELALTAPKKHTFVVGDLVRILVEDGKLERPVSAVIDDYTFAVADVEKAYDTAFIYGKKVDDLRSVDYDQLFTMNLGATQQLAMQNQMLMEENKALRTKNQEIDGRLEALETAVARLHKRNQK